MKEARWCRAHVDWKLYTASHHTQAGIAAPTAEHVCQMGIFAN
jgi:hypothetical protein